MDEETRDVLNNMSMRHDAAWNGINAKLDSHMDSLTKHRIELAEKLAVVGERANVARLRVDEHILNHCQITRDTKKAIPTWLMLVIAFAGTGVAVLSFMLALYLAFKK